MTMGLPEQELALQRLAQALGVRIKSASFDPRLFADLGRRGGLCKIKGELILLLDPEASPLERIHLLASGLCQFDSEAISMPPFIRRLLAQKRQQHAPADRWPSYLKPVPDPAVTPSADPDRGPSLA